MASASDRPQKDRGDGWAVSFIGIGAPRCGTTWLARCLAEHPAICFSQPKETFFFLKDELYARGLGFYRSFFTEPEKVCGEFSPFYFTDAKVAERMYEHNPDTKLIVLLRDPVARVRSAYEYRKQKGRELGRTLARALREEASYIENGKYMDRLQPFLERFPKEQVKVLILEEMRENPERSMRELYEFLGVRADFTPAALTREVNTTRGSSTYVPLLYRLFDVRKVLRGSRAGQALLGLLKRLGLGKLAAGIMRLNTSRAKSRTKQPLDGELANALQQHFQESNARLYTYLGREIAQWKDRQQQ